MFSLRTRLIASFALVIALCLIAAGSASVWLLRDQQAANAEERIGRLVEPLSQRLRQAQLVGAPPERIAEEMAAHANFFDVRILLLGDDRKVILDTNLRNAVVGTEIERPSMGATGSGPAEAYWAQRTNLGGEDLFLFTPRVRQSGTPAGWPFQVQDVSLIVAVPAGDVTAAWARLLPRLLIGGGIAALAGVFVAMLLARRITRPIVEMTAASRAMAQGDFSQRVEVHGEDEIAGLGNAFNDMAQQLEHSRSAMRQLVADVSHDLKTPLTSIQGFSQAMLDGVLDNEEERLRAAEVVHQEAERMRALVEDLLYLSQIEAGQLPLQLETLDIDGVVQGAANRMRFQAEARDVSIRTALAGAQVSGDERRLEQVLANLLENAVRFAPQGSEVLLRTLRLPGTPASVLIEVHNGGDPIPEADLTRVFDRFYQVDRARARSEAQVHSGLGLSIVRELVQAHGGEVSVQSSKDAGTVFSVRLPAIAAPEPRSAPREATEPATAWARPTS